MELKSGKEMSLNGWLPQISLLVFLVVAVSLILLHISLVSGARADFHEIFVGQVPVFVTKAETKELQEKGLSFRPSLPDGEGMLFVFPTPGNYGFWMKDMLFSIDILWFSGDNVLVDITPQITPDTYPQVFTPSEPIRYVLEVPAGFVERKNIKIGDQLSL